jgi:hypothetical protein
MSNSIVLSVMLYVALFIIGVVLGGAIMLFIRRVSLNRLLKVAQRKAARLEFESKAEAKGIADQARAEADKIRVTAENSSARKTAYSPSRRIWTGNLKG